MRVRNVTGKSRATPESELAANRLTIEDLKEDAEVVAYLEQANDSLGELGYTEHGFRHADLTSNIAQNIIRRLGLPEREAELAAIAAYLHDIGNLVSREAHQVSAALLARDILKAKDMHPGEIAAVMNAIGSHEESSGAATSRVSAAVILADKSDVHRSRVRNPDMTAFDIHDRVNYAAKRSFLRVVPEQHEIVLEIDIDTEVSQVMEYFEIFLERMILCRRAAEFLDCKFGLVINGTRLH